MDEGDRGSAMSVTHSAMALYAAVSAGGAIGSVLRWLVTLAFLPVEAAAFPWATLVANGAGSFLIGLFARLTGPDGRFMASPRLRHFVMTGVLGGYTTFSVFSLESLRLAQTSPVDAAVYVGSSLVVWLLAVWLGDLLAQRYTRLKGARS
jgi:CrcB protein